MVPTLDSLPIELYYAILSHIPAYDLQSTVLALTRAAPRTAIPQHLIFHCVRLRHSDQVVQLYLRLRGSPGDADHVRYFFLECWTVDADVVVNLTALLPKLKELTLFIGPSFAPEHTEEMFQKPKDSLKLISLRFRPYVQRATYYQFLKGAYFDSTLTALTRWPAADLPTLSIVQDPLDEAIAPARFAQPLVFFRLDCLSTLAHSPLVKDLRHFRLRIPARQAARFLYSLPNALPRVELLDMSTCNVLESDVEGILGRFMHLRTLILDGCYIVSQRIVGAEEQGPEEALNHWAALGKVMALSGAKYARERERRLKVYLEALRARAAALQTAEPLAAVQQLRRPKRGRRGLATATISLRKSPPKASVNLPKLPAGATSGPILAQRIRILPSVPALRSLATTPPPFVGPDKHDAIRTEFAKGWNEGTAQLCAIRARLRMSWGNGVRVVRVDPECEEDEEDGDGEDGLAGLMDVEDERAFVVKTKVPSGSERTEGGDGAENVADEAEMLGLEDGTCPLLCLAGPGRKEGHVEGCGHQLGWEVWRDEL